MSPTSTTPPAVQASGPLSDQRLAEIRAAAVAAVERHPSTTFMAPCESLADAVLDAVLPTLLAEVDRLRAELAKYVGQEPTLTEEALYAHEEQVRQRIAQDVHRADRPVFAKTEDPELVVKTTRAIDVHLIELGPAAPYWVPEAGDGR